MRKFLKFITSRFFILGLILFSQLVLIVLFCLYLVPTSYGVWTVLAFYLLDILGIIFIINGQSAGPYKLAWISCIALLPLGGGFVLWFLFANKRTTKHQKRKTGMYRNSIAKYSYEDNSLKELEKKDVTAYRISSSIYKSSKTTCYAQSEATYFELGQKVWPVMLEELRKAKKFIFIEYFIIERGEFFNSILEILKAKVKEGVDVRLIYDDFGCMSKVPWFFNHELESYGIKCYVFNRYYPIITLKMNNRDHRKFMIIDGVVGFTGGINLADEYVNVVKKFGNEWKDNCLMLKGPAVFGMTSLFLSQWINISKKMEDFDLYSYEKNKELLTDKINPSGYIQTFGDIPYDYESIGENVYLDLIYKAKKSVYICSPYIVPDNDMIVALTNAAHSGVDVRLVIPGVPDKAITYQLTLSYLPVLLRAGVKIYRYKDSFIHDKCFLTDDTYACVGTINLDLRSLYLHMENAVFMYKCDCINDIKNDFDYMFSNSIPYTLPEALKTNIFIRAFRALIRVFAAMF